MAHVTVDSVRLLNVGVELGYLNQNQCDEAFKRQAQLARGGIELPLIQILLERRFLAPSQVKMLMLEVEYRRSKGLADQQKQKEASPVPAPVAAVKKEPRKFGQFELVEQLSDGQNSRIFKARDTLMNRWAVVKILPKALSGDSQWSERFKREMQIAGSLNHPNIVGAYGAGEIDGNPYMALEYILGVSLRDRLEREGNLPEKTAWQIAREIAKGLAYASESGVLHRNIKPDNILCGTDGKIKIIDMGCSKSMSDTSALTMEGTTIGTPFYISPEQARGTRDLDGRTDLYSLGCTVYHMLTGSVPFFGEQITEVMVKHTEAPRPDPRDMLPEISVGSAQLIQRLMAIDPTDRPGTADELIVEIETLLSTLPDPVAVIRPVAKVVPSEIRRGSRSSATIPAPVLKKSSAVMQQVHVPEPPPVTKRPAGLLARISAWFAALFSKKNGGKS